MVFIGLIIGVTIVFFYMFFYEESTQKKKNVSKTKHKKFSDGDIAWANNNMEALTQFYKKNFGLYRNEIFKMAETLRKEKRNKQALGLYIKVLYCDLSGKGNDNSTDSKDSLMLAPGIIKRILKLKEHFTEEMLDSCWKVKFPFHYCNEEIFANIVRDILNGIDSNEILDKYRPRMKKTPKSAMPIDFGE